MFVEGFFFVGFEYMFITGKQGRDRPETLYGGRGNSKRDGSKTNKQIFNNPFLFILITVGDCQDNSQNNDR